MLTSAALVIDVVWPDLDSALPPGGLLFAKYLTRVIITADETIPQLDLRILHDVVVSDQVFRSSSA